MAGDVGRNFTADRRDYVFQRARVVGGPASPPNRGVELFVVRRELDRLTYTRRRGPLVGRDAAEYDRLCDREMYLLLTPEA